MTDFRVRDAAKLLGVSDDTVRRWIESGTVKTTADDAGRKLVPGTELARLAHEHAGENLDVIEVESSARNRMTGIVTRVVTDTVMAQVEMQCGPYRIVSLISSEAVRDLGLEPGTLAQAVVKSTNVIIETPPN